MARGRGSFRAAPPSPTPLSPISSRNTVSPDTDTSQLARTVTCEAWACFSTLVKASSRLRWICSTSCSASWRRAGSSAASLATSMPAARRRGCRQSRSVASTLTRPSCAGTTLTDLNTAVANTSTTTVTGMPPMMSGTPSLPTDVTLRPAASHCAALRSGTYQILTPRTHTTMTDQYDQGLFAGLRISATIDAAGVLNATLCGDPS